MKEKTFQRLTLFLLFFSINVEHGFTQQVLSKPAAPPTREVKLYADEKIPQSAFAVSELNKALLKAGYHAKTHPLTDFKQGSNNGYKIILTTGPGASKPGANQKGNMRAVSKGGREGFTIRSTGGKNGTIRVVGQEAAGLMYGGFDLAETIETAGLDSVRTKTQDAYMKMRGVKFNIPLDVRTPSYTDMSDVAQKNIAEMWNFDFWKEYIDSLARFRYNFVSLWNLHPFPSLVRVPDYPDIALDDVHRSTANFKENYNLNGIGFDTPEVVNKYEVLKKISMDDKIALWRRIMRYGKDRNVDFYFVTWNIFVNGTSGKYGITEHIDNKVTRDYFRKSVKQMFITYPDLAGIGLTTGENMYGNSTEKKEDWAFETFGQGVLDVVKEQPDRKLTFIHRQHQTGALDIAKKFAPVADNKNINFIFSFKYAEAHALSSTNQVFHQNFVKDIQRDKNLKTIWTIRNDDNYYFRWGAPGFVREFIQNIPYDVSEGFYYGSDQYIPGREFLSLDSNSPRQLEIAKSWYHWLMWGRLGYDPKMSDQHFQQILSAHFPGVNGTRLFSAWQEASLIYPLTTGFHWGPLDFQWYIESGQSRPDFAQTPTGYHDLNRFISLPPHKGTGYVSIPEYVKAVAQNGTVTGKAPPELATQIQQHAERALELLGGITAGGNPELLATLEDIRSMAHLGLYYAHKIRAATHLALFRENLKKDERDKLIEAQTASASAWRMYASLSLSNYKNPLWTNRVGYVDWRKNYTYVLNEIAVNGGSLLVPPMQPTPGGTILEAEVAEVKSPATKNRIAGFTGQGYLDSDFSDARQAVTFTYNAPRDGLYSLEFRYTLKRQDVYESPVIINGARAGEIIFWMN
ncbi:MAG TPA: hypothetical protein VEZ17_12805, partial [Chitinophagaceae bacterium]|nr:hypothetical protein [Chitinophagaceae bacterium]